MLQRATIKNERSIYIWQDVSMYKGQLYCPHCKSEVIARKGKVKVHHFSHKSLKDCPYSNKESAEHLGMKKNLFKLITEKYPDIKIELEKSIVPNRIADMVIYGKKNLVVEFQASQIDFSEIQSRTIDYNREKHPVLWIFHISRFSNAKGSNEFPTEASVPHELLMMDKLDCLFVMNDEGIIKRCSIDKSRKRTKTRYFLNFFNVNIKSDKVFKLNEILQIKEDKWLFLCQLGKNSIYSKRNLHFGYWLLKNNNLNKKDVIAKIKEIIPPKTFYKVENEKRYKTHIEFYLFVEPEKNLNLTKDLIITKEKMSLELILYNLDRLQEPKPIQIVDPLGDESKEVAASVEVPELIENIEDQQKKSEYINISSVSQPINKNQNEDTNTRTINHQINESSSEEKSTLFQTLSMKVKKLLRWR